MPDLLQEFENYRSRMNACIFEIDHILHLRHAVENPEFYRQGSENG